MKQSPQDISYISPSLIPSLLTTSGSCFLDKVSSLSYRATTLYILLWLLGESLVVIPHSLKYLPTSEFFRLSINICSVVKRLTVTLDRDSVQYLLYLLFNSVGNEIRGHGHEFLILQARLDQCSRGC